MLDLPLFEVLVPVRSQLRSQEVRLVDEKNEPFLALANVLNVLFQVRCVEKLGVSCVDDLHKEIRLFDDTPKLSPNFYVFLKRCDRQIYRVLFLHRNVPPPFQEGHILLLCNLLR